MTDKLNNYNKMYKSACRMCHGGCGVLVETENGKVIKVTGDPESPINKGRLCIKGRASLEHLNNPHRLKYPLKREGKRGEGKWKRVSWDEALDTVCMAIKNAESEVGMESVTIVQGTGRHHFQHVIRFANVLGTPNWMEAGAAQCFFPRIKAGEITYGCLPVCDYYGEVNPGCVLVWGHNPIVSGADCESQFSIRDCLKKGTRLIVIDPRRIELAEKADLWLQIRPGTDAALALGMLHEIISKRLYDRDFVEKWTHGFDKLKEHVKYYSPERVAKITWVPAEKIRKAAQIFATTKPATLEWGVALEHTPNSFQTVRAVSLLPGITGNYDVPGGWIEGMNLLPDPDRLLERLPMEQRKKRLGAEKYRFLSGSDMNFSAAHVPTVLNAIETGEPYPVKTLLAFGSNMLLGFGNSPEVYKTLKKLDFISVMDLYMTPTAQIADLVLPAAGWLELDQVIGVPYKASHLALAQQKVATVGESRPDEEVLLDLSRRLGLDYGAETVKEIFNQQLAAAGENFTEFAGISFDQLKEQGFIITSHRYKKYENRGFNTPSGKMELYSTLMENYGYEPLPYYQEPPETPYSKPEIATKYPLILTTGGRVQHYFHSEYRQIASLRSKHPDPIVEINPETAAFIKIEEGDWAWIETPRGRIRQKVKLEPGIDPRVVNCQHGWWYPEEPSPEHGVWRSNANVLTNNHPPYDPVMGTYQLRALLCRVYK